LRVDIVPQFLYRGVFLFGKNILAHVKSAEHILF
jgi:hypothetical protein